MSKTALRWVHVGNDAGLGYGGTGSCSHDTPALAAVLPTLQVARARTRGTSDLLGTPRPRVGGRLRWETACESRGRAELRPVQQRKGCAGSVDLREVRQWCWSELGPWQCHGGSGRCAPRGRRGARTQALLIGVFFLLLRVVCGRTDASRPARSSRAKMSPPGNGDDALVDDMAGDANDDGNEHAESSKKATITMEKANEIMDSWRHANDVANITLDAEKFMADLVLVFDCRNAQDQELKAIEEKLLVHIRKVGRRHPSTLHARGFTLGELRNAAQPPCRGASSLRRRTTSSSTCTTRTSTSTPK